MSLDALPGPIPVTSVFYGTAPPANPIEGTGWILPVDAWTNWQFRYHVGATYPWEFIGGGYAWAPVVDPGTERTRSAIAWGDLDSPAPVTPGPTFTLPRSGEFEVNWGYYVRNASGSSLNSAVSQLWRVGEAAGTNPQPPTSWTPTNTAMRHDVPAGGYSHVNHWNAIGRRGDGSPLLAGDQIKVCFYMYAIGGSGVYISQRWMRVRPIRVS